MPPILRPLRSREGEFLSASLGARFPNCGNLHSGFGGNGLGFIQKPVCHGTPCPAGGLREGPTRPGVGSWRETQASGQARTGGVTCSRRPGGDLKRLGPGPAPSSLFKAREESPRPTLPKAESRVRGWGLREGVQGRVGRVGPPSPSCPRRACAPRAMLQQGSNLHLERDSLRGFRAVAPLTTHHPHAGIARTHTQRPPLTLRPSSQDQGVRTGGTKKDWWGTGGDRPAGLSRTPGGGQCIWGG